MALRDLDPESHLRDPARKQRYVTTLFDTIAPRYDRFTRLFSFGMDAAWKRQLANWVREVVRPGDVVLDLACGTGDVIGAVERLSGRSVGDLARLGGEPGESTAICRPSMIVGLDPSAQMLQLAKERLPLQRPDPSITSASPSSAGSPNRSSPHPPNRPTAQPAVRLLRADIMALPIRSATAAAVTVGYGFRNTPDLAVALEEVARVLRPEGWLFDLDFFLPERAGWRRLYLGYLRLAGRAVGWRWHAEPETYGYIARSLEYWLTPPRFQGALRSAGFRVEREVRHLGGGICLHAAQRAG